VLAEKAEERIARVQAEKAAVEAEKAAVEAEKAAAMAQGTAQIMVAVERERSTRTSLLAAEGVLNMRGYMGEHIISCARQMGFILELQVRGSLVWLQVVSCCLCFHPQESARTS
jgi:hypothetical protein